MSRRVLRKFIRTTTVTDDLPMSTTKIIYYLYFPAICSANFLDIPLVSIELLTFVAQRSLFPMNFNVNANIDT